jgi:hypothetical protein
MELPKMTPQELMRDAPTDTIPGGVDTSTIGSLQERLSANRRTVASSMKNRDIDFSPTQVNNITC